MLVGLGAKAFAGVTPKAGALVAALEEKLNDELVLFGAVEPNWKALGAALFGC